MSSIVHHVMKGHNPALLINDTSPYGSSCHEGVHSCPLINDTSPYGSSAHEGAHSCPSYQ
jgi:hypothetical protein